jgi:hypothetical protein
MARNRGSEQEEIQEPDGEAVRRRLAELGVPLEVLSEAVRIGYGMGDFTTKAHPRTYQGTVVWGEITGALRTGLAKVAWDIDDTDNIARAVRPDEKVSIVVVAGNEFTGLRDKHEQLSTRRKRGPAGVRIVKENTQYTLQLNDVARESDDLVASLDGTWFFLYYRVGDVARTELSYARAVSTSGKLLSWKERLILPDVDLTEPTPRTRTNDDTPPEVDVTITRRAS